MIVIAIRKKSLHYDLIPYHPLSLFEYSQLQVEFEESPQESSRHTGRGAIAAFEELPH